MGCAKDKRWRRSIARLRNAAGQHERKLDEHSGRISVLERSLMHMESSAARAEANSNEMLELAASTRQVLKELREDHAVTAAALTDHIRTEARDRAKLLLGILLAVITAGGAMIAALLQLAIGVG